MRSHDSHAQHRRRGYTMTEILVVIGIIVLLLAIGVPAFNLIRGGRSIDAAENQVAAMLGRARSNAIGLQKVHGVMFVLDTRGDQEPGNDRVLLLEVIEGDLPLPPDAPAPGSRDIYLDATDTEMVALPPGVCVQTLNESSTQITDRYIGFNKILTYADGGAAAPEYHYGGVILFNGRGQVINRSYGFVTNRPAPGGQGNPPQTNIDRTVFNVSGWFVHPGAPGSQAAAPATAPNSAFGFVLFDRQQFLGNGGDSDRQLDASVAAAVEDAEENWINNNAVAFMINRYNGSLVRAAQ